MTLTYAELFAGAGGLSMGLELAGWEPVAHAEIEPHARAVLRHHWPECRLDGDVSAINGADYAGVTLLSGGSPCQDLSIAGKRNGMTEGSGTRSSLYFEQVRIWNESGAPYFLWENVLGAFSSNNGRDFAAVLSALVGAAVPVPANGWESAGVAAGRTGVAAWRVLDCQFFGPPQRRRRVFVLGTRTGGVDPAEVLAVSEGVRGDSATGEQAREGAAADAGGGTAAESGGIVAPLHSGPRAQSAVVRSIATFSTPAIGDIREDNVASTITKNTGGSGETQNPAYVLTYDARGNGDGQTVNTMAGDHQNRVTDYTAIVLRNREGKPGGGKGPLLSEEKSLTLQVANDQVVFVTDGQKNAAYSNGLALTLNATNEQPYLVHPTLNTTHFGKHAGCNQHVGELAEILPATGIPRRLMPVECERLMGWPDGHTATGVDEQGRTYALSDTARYRLCGNGVASPVAGWIAWRLRLAIEAHATP